ncbi:MAG: putative entry exclusion protein TrbK-alt [Afipia felis]|jgi:conjugative transfer region protein TrbK|uniref:putative entry exclusion protein TrbK-alt n=1 Tax=Rhizobium sp. WW_1 TaxID=1907375 RepID=UPI00064681AD|nr:putative entry exclusion protein TrbK-alt [Rhizobium sp. WW_1]MBN9604633.1 putative entry exclusion protein TrbK-alt [Afipia felis]RKD74843.1 conjugative transfer region protein TrbK [Rhizobium sp. WW_1]
MDGKMLARVSAIVFIAVAVTATAIEMARHEDAPIDQIVDPAGAETIDPLRAELIRCGGIGEAGPRDPSCLRAWAENRRRFLAPGARPAERLPDAQLPRPATTSPAPAVPLQPEEAR